jgi:hypothetical protein
MTAGAQGLLFHEDHCNVQTLGHGQRLISNGLKRRETGSYTTHCELLYQQAAGYLLPRQEHATCLAGDPGLVSQSLPFGILHHRKT